MNTHGTLELLESRIAPAAVLTFTDVDGDTVVVKTSKGTNADLAPLIKTEAMGMGVAIREIDLSLAWTIFDGTDLSVLVTKKGPMGDGLVNVRYIDGEGFIDGNAMNLGRVAVQGDLGQLQAGRNDGLAVKAVKVESFGVADAALYELNGLASFFKGGLGTVEISGLMTNASFNFTEAQSISVGTMDDAGFFASAAIAKAKVLGAMNQSSFKAASFGRVLLDGISNSTISATGTIGTLTVLGEADERVTFGAGSIGKLLCKQSFAGEANLGSLKQALIVGDMTGFVQASSIGTLTVNGSVTGTKAETGYVSVAGNVTAIRVKGDVLGGLEKEIGYFEIGGSVGSLRIGGSLKGFPALGVNSPFVEVDDNGCIRVGGDLGKLFIGGDLVGTSILSAGHESDSTGAVIVQGHLGSAIIGGSIRAGQELQNGLQSSGTIQVGKNLGSLLVKGDVIGGFNNRAVISALGADGPGTALAIGKIIVLGDVKDTNIRAGDSASEIVNKNNSRDESIGLLKVGGDFFRSTVLAGQSGMIDAPEITSKIARIVIGGTATGGDAGVAYGFLAEEIGALRVAGTNYAFTAGALNDAKIDLDPSGNTIAHEKSL